MSAASSDFRMPHNNPRGWQEALPGELNPGFLKHGFFNLDRIYIRDVGDDSIGSRRFLSRPN